MSLYRLPTTPEELMNGKWDGPGDRINGPKSRQNHESRCLGGLVLDLSESMRPHIEDVARSYVRAFDKLKKDALLGMRIELGLVRCAGVEPSVLQDFQPVGETTSPAFKTDLGTPLGASMLLMGQLIENRRRAFDAEGLDYHPAIVLVLTDGAPTESSDVLDKARLMVARHEADRIAKYFPIVTEDAVKDMIAYLFRVEPRRLRDKAWEELLAWMVSSLIIVSSTRVGDKIHLPPTDPWSTV